MALPSKSTLCKLNKNTGRETSLDLLPQVTQCIDPSRVYKYLGLALDLAAMDFSRARRSSTPPLGRLNSVHRTKFISTLMPSFRYRIVALLSEFTS